MLFTKLISHLFVYIEIKVLRHLFGLYFLVCSREKNQGYQEGKPGKYPPGKIVSKLSHQISADKNSNSFSDAEISGSEESLKNVR